MRIEITILGDPKSQKRHRHTSAGKFVRTYDPSAADKTHMRVILQEKAPPKPLTGPVRVDITWYFPYRKGDYGTGRNADKLKISAPTYHTTKPDRDNADKIVLDAMSGIYFMDDRQVCGGELRKYYSERPRTEIVVTEL